jgi:hypothetical protein
MTRFLLPALAAVLVLSACDTTDPDPQPVPLTARVVADLVADPTAGRDPVTGAPIQTGRFTLYSLRENRVVLSYTEADPAIRQRDSASTAWDIGFQGQRIIFNGGTSGPGQGAAQLVEGTFSEITEAPADGYAADGSNTDCASGVVLCPITGHPDAWYTYVPFAPGDPTQGGFLTPRAGRTVALKTAVGTYAKVRITSYYQGSLTDAQITPASPSRYYSFEYIHQPDGSRNFQTTTTLP